mmetsp:Transcript_11227/g.12715  ORF Transcript_11227/g.12715 Transcript_11227/m.12715 type:complete len:115 (+) Transcript_11227:156-500(+)
MSRSRQHKSHHHHLHHPGFPRGRNARQQQQQQMKYITKGPSMTDDKRTEGTSSMTDKLSNDDVHRTCYCSFFFLIFSDTYNSRYILTWGSNHEFKEYQYHHYLVGVVHEYSSSC